MNAHKAVDLGVGLKVERPFPEEGREEAAAAKYRADVAVTLSFWNDSLHFPL